MGKGMNATLIPFFHFSFGYLLFRLPIMLSSSLFSAPAVKPFVFALSAALVAVASAVAAPQLRAADAPAAAEAQAVEYQLPWQSLHMGTLIQGQVYAGTPEETKRLAGIMESEIERFDDMMSVHKETVLNDVNRRAGERVTVTPEIAEMTRLALHVAEETDGAFEPTIGPVVNLWKIGFGGDTVPSDAAIDEAVKRVDYRKVEVGETEGSWYVRIAPGQNIDMGGIAKGYIGQKLSERLKAEGASHALLDLGGNVVAVGEKSPGHPWRVGLQSPDQTRGAYFGILAVSDMSVITSGAYERNFEKDGKRYGHILSAKTGRPVLTDIASVTIADRNGGRADALCTALFAMGWEKAKAFLSAHEDVHAVLLLNDMKTVHVSRELRSAFTLTDETMHLEGDIP